jgi:hypothetical protein
MCRRQNLIGLPKNPLPRYDYNCPIFRFVKMTQAIKGKTANRSNLKSGELLHMDFAFWDVLSQLMIIYATTRMLWLFCTASKNPPLHIRRWFFTNLRR